MDKFKFEKLIIWQRTMDFGEDIDKLSDEFPDKEKFNLSSQIRRASNSIALNISENEFDSFYDESFNLMNRMRTFRKNIN